VTWSPDGQAVASCGADATVRLWRADGDPVDALIGHSDWVNSVTWSPDGRSFASGGLDGVIRLWRAK
jgi:WD40 repeat protein